MTSHQDEKRPHVHGDLAEEITADARPVSTNADEEGLRPEREAVLDYAGSSAKTDPEEIRLVRKLDIWILPMAFMLNFLNLMQRQAISVAPLGGLNDDLGLAGTQFSTVVSVHYVGYIIGQLPSNLLITRVPPSFGLSAGCLIAGITSVTMAAVHDYKGLLLQRFFLGVIAAPVWPGTLYIASSFYKRKELGVRLGLLYTANIISTAIQGLIAAPVFSELGGLRGLGGWQWLFIIFGIATGVFAIIGFFILPNTPATTWWLTPREKELAQKRMIVDTPEKEPDVSILRGMKQVVKDKHMWLFCIMHHMHTASSSFRNFLPTLFNTLGYNRTTTLGLTCPPYVLAAGLAVVTGLTSGKFNERTWHMTGLKITAALGFVLGCVSMNTGSRMVAAFLFVGWTYPHTSLTLAWVGMTCGQTKEKRAAALAIVNTSASISQIWAPYLWPSTAAPRYIMPLAASAAFCVFGICLVWTMRLLLAAENKRLRREDGSATLLYAY